jgi:ribonuclease-3
VPDYQPLEDRLGYAFSDPALLGLALTHPSVARSEGKALGTNQRLEFLGDAVLQLVLTRELSPISRIWRRPADQGTREARKCPHTS